MNEPKYVEETLRWCNRKRKEKGKLPLIKLPKGIRGKGDSCPCGEATELFVGRDFFTDDPSMTFRSKLPRSVQRFVSAFDKGKLPQYDKSPQVKD